MKYIYSVDFKSYVVFELIRQVSCVCLNLCTLSCQPLKHTMVNYFLLILSRMEPLSPVALNWNNKALFELHRLFLVKVKVPKFEL